MFGRITKHEHCHLDTTEEYLEALNGPPVS